MEKKNLCILYGPNGNEEQRVDLCPRNLSTTRMACDPTAGGGQTQKHGADTDCRRKRVGAKDAWGLEPLVSDGIKIYIPRPLPYPGSR